ncbi:TerD family protein [Nocardioides dongxiaopingii]|uniref:TerD family protein n=1 Tax=Nocardioides sp. S-1144 TaxID=2582905 RepID=UPI002696E1D9|nr:TerD family protein [Nocardioides sp. S-1144]
MSGVTDPRGAYRADLASDNITWFTQQAPPDALVDHVLGLLDLRRTDLRPTPHGGGVATTDGSLRLTAVAGPHGAACSVWSDAPAGATRVTEALNRESHAMMAAFNRGEQATNAAHARWAPLVGGAVRPDFEGSPVLGVVEDADVVPILAPPPPPAPPPASSSAPAPAGGPGRVVSLRKGGNVSLTKEVAELSTISVGLGWDVADGSGPGYDLDASAIMCGSSGRVLSDQHFVFFNNLASPDGTVRHTGDNLTGEGDGDDEVIEVDLARMAAEVDRIVFPVSIYDADARRQSFGQVHNAFIRLVDAAEHREIARYDLSEDASVETAMIFGEVYRRDGEWKFRAVGQGYASGLHGIALEFGVDV